MNSENSKMSDLHRLLSKGVIIILLYQILASTYYKWKNMKKLYKNKKFKILAPMQNYKFELPDRSYSVLDI